MSFENHFRSLGGDKPGDPTNPMGFTRSTGFTPQPVPNLVRAAMVRVVAGERMGRGFMVDATGHIVTELTLVDEANRIKASTFDNDVFLARITHKDVSRGLALIEIPERTPGHLTLGDVGSVDVGDDCLLVAKQSGETTELGKGIITALRHINGVAVIQFEAPGELGAGGTPILSAQGDVIGICSSRFEKNRDNVGFAVSANELKSLLYAEWADFDIDKVFKKIDV